MTAENEPLDERTVRACIEALPYPGSNAQYRAALETLLPKPDPAEVLVERWGSEGFWLDGRKGTWAFAHWLISEGYIREERL